MIGRRRKSLPAELGPAYDAFMLVLGELEPAKAALTEVLPGTRMPGRPISDALAAFERGLDAARVTMPEWRRPELETEWEACALGLGESQRMAGELRAGAGTPDGFEALLGTVQALLDPLAPFERAALRFRDLRRR